MAQPKRKRKTSLVRQLEESIKLAKAGKLKKLDSLDARLKHLDGLDRKTSLDDPGDRKRK